MPPHQVLRAERSFARAAGPTQRVVGPEPPRVPPGRLGVVGDEIGRDGGLLWEVEGRWRGGGGEMEERPGKRPCRLLHLLCRREVPYLNCLVGPLHHHRAGLGVELLTHGGPRAKVVGGAAVAGEGQGWG